MRPIAKGSEPKSFTAWKSENASASVTIRYVDLQRPQKDDVRSALCVEQGFVCCYCETRIRDSSETAKSDAVHIEHLRPQSADRARDLDFSNMLASCNADPINAHCGQFRRDHELPVDPTMSDCRRHLRFRSSGIVEGATPDGTRTITLLKLDATSLTRRRSAAIAGLDFTASKSELDRLAILVGARSLDGTFQAFASALVAAYRRTTNSTRRFFANAASPSPSTAGRSDP